MKKSLIKCALLFLLFQFNLETVAQNVYEDLTIELENKFCHCMGEEISSLEEKQLKFDMAETVRICIKNVFEKHIPLLEKVPEGATQEEHYKFLEELPKKASNKMLYDCPVARKAILQSNADVLTKECEERIFMMSGGLVNARKVCECSLHELSENRGNINPDDEIVNQIAKNCIRKNLDFLNNFEALHMDEIVVIYKNVLREKTEFSNIDLDKYCDCYFSKVAKLILSDDSLLDEILSDSKKLNRIETKCKKRAKN